MVVRSHTPRRCAGDEGAALVEAAFVTPVLLFVLLGILESGLLFRTYMTLSAATQDGARTAAILGNDAGTDFEIIQDVQKATAAIPQSQIRNLVVFKATATPPSASVPPATCTNALARIQVAGANPCNTYVPSSDWNANPILDKPNYNCTATGYSKGYCPTTRAVALNPPPGPDYLGVYISVQHQYVSKLFGTTQLLSETTITRLEPQKISS